MLSPFLLFPLIAIGFVGLALFADDVDDPANDDTEETTENPFASDDDSDGSSIDEGVESLDVDPLPTTDEARSLCDTAMSALHDGDAARAFDRLSAHWAFASDEMTQLQGEVERTRAVVGDRYGAALDHRLVRKDTVGDVLLRLVYLERFERHGLRWRFTFYDGREGWTLNDVSFDDKIEALLD